RADQRRCDDRDTSSRGARRADCQGRRFSLDRHQRSHAVHPRHGPRSPAARGSARCAAPCGPAPHRAHRRGCQHARPSCSGLRRARLGAAGGAAARGARRAGALGRACRHPAAEGANPECLTERLPRSGEAGSRAGERRRGPRPRIAGISALRGLTMKGVLASLQKIGGALMLPIAVLPIAGLLLRLGQPGLLDSASLAAAGGAVFTNLGLLFAIGVSVGLARENHGAAGLASVVAYLVATKGAEVLIAVPPGAVADLSGHARELAVAAYKEHELFKLNVPIGILSGL